jgi:predicted transcriptional regulator
MTAKGQLRRDESKRTHVYTHRQAETETQRDLVSDLLRRAFGGSAKGLVMQALSAQKASPGEIAEIRRLLDQMDGSTKPVKPERKNS